MDRKPQPLRKTTIPHSHLGITGNGTLKKHYPSNHKIIR